jgi:hypothetical protein
MLILFALAGKRDIAAMSYRFRRLEKFNVSDGDDSLIREVRPVFECARSGKQFNTLSGQQFFGGAKVQ